MDFTKDICFNTEKIYKNSECQITYKGQLFKNNSDKVFISYGYGNLWDDKNECELQKSENGFTGSLYIKDGENLQFCFHDSNNNWDNNNYQNYITNIEEKEIENIENFENELTNSLLEAKPIVESEKEIDIKINDTNLSPEETTPFKPVTLSSEIVDIYKNTKLDSINSDVIPEKTIFNKINNDKKIETKEISFNSETKEKIDNYQKAFDNNNVSTGSIYVSSLLKDIEGQEKPQSQPKFIEEITINNSLVPVKEKRVTKKGVSKIYLLKKRIKISISKFIKLIKTALNYDENHI